MMGSLRLASAGDDIKLWDSRTYTIIEQFNPHNSNVKDICWSSNNEYLSSVCSSGSEKIGFSTVKNDTVTSMDLSFLKGRQFVDFSSNSRYLLSGDDSAINIWDLKARTLKKSYKGHKGVVTCAKFSWNDVYIASGAETGEIILHNAVSGISLSPLVVPKLQSIKQIQYSLYKKSLLGAVSEDGGVCLWDTSKHRLIHHFTDCHISPATGLNFSPINEIFLMSIGLDKRINCYDIEKKVCLKTMVAESPLTSIDVMDDGVTVAVGSTRGKVYIYDLRKGSPVRTLVGHKSSVQCLKFQNSFQREAHHGKSSSVTSKHSLSPQGQRPTNSDYIEDSQPRKDFHNGYDQLSRSNRESVELFSPVRDGMTSQSVQSREESRTPGTSTDYTSFVKQNNSSNISSGIFSPLANADSFPGSLSHRSKGSMPLSPLYSTHGNTNKSGLVQAWGTPDPPEYNQYPHPESEVESKENYRTVNYSSGPYSPPRVKNSPGSAAHTGSPPIHDKYGASPRLEPSSPNKSSTNLISKSVSPRQTTGLSPSSTHSETGSHTSDLLAPPTGLRKSFQTDMSLYTNPTVTASAAIGEADLPSKSAADFPSPDGISAVSSSQSEHVLMGHREHADRAINSSAAEAAFSHTFQTDLLRSLIQEAQEDMMEQIHVQIRNLHVDMIRQFQVQLNEMKNMMQHYSVNRELVEEVQRLREENKQLKRNF